MDLKEIDILGSDIEHHWYYRSKANAMLKLVSKKVFSVILDIGAGSGFFSKKLLSKTLAREAWCVDINYENDLETHYAEKKIYYKRSIEEINADLILLMDVLEHVDNDIDLLKTIAKKVPQGAFFLITVPAFQFLWSGHDVFLEHKRRYSLRQLEFVIQKAGLKLNQGSYFFCSVFPIAATIRLINNFMKSNQHNVKSQLTQHHPIINKLLEKITEIELPFFLYNRLFGLSVFCLAEKP